MKIIDNIKKLFSSKVAETGSAEPKTHPTGYEVNAYGTDFTANKRKYLEAMTGWTYAAVSAIADEIGAIQLKLFEVKGDDKVEEIKDHPSLELLYKVNDFTTKFDHFWLTDAYLELAGESPWFVNKNDKGEPVDLFFLRPDLIRPIVNKDGELAGYKYKYPDGKEVDLDIDSIIFLKYPNPANPIRGKGVVESSARTIDIDNEAEKWNFNFFKNEARPDYVIKVKNIERLTKEQRDKLKKSVEKLHKGTSNAHKLMVLFGDLDIDTLGFSHKDMDFSEMQTFTRDKILSMFRVPKAIVALTDGVNFANAKTAELVFTKHTIKPKMERITQQLNEFYLPMFKGTEKMFLDFVSPVPEDDEAKLKKYDNGLKNAWLTIDEVRAMEGLEAINGGDVPYLPANLLPLGTSSVDSEKGYANRIRHVKARNGDIIKFDRTIEKLESAIIKSLKKKKKTVTIVKNDTSKIQGELSTKEKELFWEAKSVLYTKYFPQILKEQLKIFVSQEKSTLNKLSKQKRIDLEQDRIRPVKLKEDDLDIDNLLLDEPKEEKKEIKFLLPLFTLLFRDSGNETFDLIGSDDTMNMNRKVVKDQLKRDSKIMAKEVTKTTNDQLKLDIAEGLKAGEGVADIQKRVKRVFKNAKENRAKAIANTETIRYSSNATERSFVDSGVVRAKQWQVNPDACPICIPLQGKIVDLETSFFKKGDTTTTSDGKTFKLDYDNVLNPPIHVNCRCFIDHQVPIYTSKGWKQIGDIKVDDLVLTHKKRFKKVTELIRTPKQQPDVTTLEFDLGIYKTGKNKRHEEKLTLTSNHPVLSNGKWVDAGQIKQGNKIDFFANECKYCKKLIPWFANVCSHSCQSKMTTKKQWSNDNHRQIVSKKISKSMLTQWKIGDRSYEQLENARKKCLSKNTSIEKLTKEALDNIGIQTDSQYQIKRNIKTKTGDNRYYYPDLRVKNTNILIECDGDYWHNLKNIKERDIQRQEELESMGFMILRFSESKIKTNINSVKLEVQRVLSNHSGEYMTIPVEVKSVKHWVPKKPRMLYNFEVEDDNSYIAKGYVVHNCDIVPVFIKVKDVESCIRKTNKRVAIREKIVKVKSVQKERELDDKLKEVDIKLKEVDDKIESLNTEKIEQGKLTKDKKSELDKLKGVREKLVENYNIKQDNE